ncbi:hypothetical protein L1987_43097 [Smallanthus sonchifolius]|uniref:Uncharacterized protein n=1 Tax=Smallanthus sonchifolius TaxID=185202 RepID=A0ACB9GLM9_9ASTR|nr:hypothetical protein L1987_43097 [Smallanthus sonchifolius]
MCSHSVCMIDAFIDEHLDSNPVEDAVDRDERGMIDEPAPNLGEISELALELEKLLDEPDEYGEEDVL